MGRPSLKIVQQKRIIRAFYEVSRREGLENASIAKVAERLKVNPSLVIHYFKSKQELLHGLIEFTLERYRLIYSPAEKEGNPEERLLKTIQNLFSRRWNSLFDDGVFYSGYSLIFRNRTIKSHYKNLHDHLRLMLRSTLTEAKEDGVIEIEDVAQTADLIFVFVEGAYYYLSMVSNKEEYARRLAVYEQTIMELLGLKTETYLNKL